MPIFPYPFYQKLDPTYRDKIEELEDNIQDSFKKRKFLDEFYRNYLMPKELIKQMTASNREYCRLAINPYSAKSENIKRIETEIINTFIYHYQYDICCFPHKKSLDQDKFLIKPIFDEKNEFKFLEPDVEKAVQEILQYPHRDLKLYLWKYMALSSNIVPESLVRKCNEMEILYDEIKAVEESDLDQWLNLLSYVGDGDFLKNTVEDRIGINLTNKSLWKSYINYLEMEYIQNLDISYLEEMLQIYSKYVRFFLDDCVMMAEYMQKAEMYNIKVPVRFSNRFCFEVPEPTSLDSGEQKEICGDLSRLHADRFSVEIVIFPKEVIFKPSTQNFPFQLTFIQYILSTANPSVLQKLYFSCKWFFIQRQELLCNRFILTEITYGSNDILKFVGNSIRCSINPLSQMPYKKFYITNSLCIKYELDYMLQSIINDGKIFKCDAKFINIEGQKLAEKDFDFLVGNVSYLILKKTTIIKESGIPLMIDEILRKVPKLEFLIYNENSSNHVEPPRQYNFSLIEMQSKLYYFEIFQSFDNFDSNEFCAFIANNAAPSATFSVTGGFTADKKTELQQCFNQYMNEWEMPGPKPVLKLQ
uniref:Uncharacterized protein n=1 Tax=Panagrolaimus davidi TaxID=227884 RepID=A0A914PFQ5_9BILA